MFHAELFLVASALFPCSLCPGKLIPLLPTEWPSEHSCVNLITTSAAVMSCGASSSAEPGLAFLLSSSASSSLLQTHHHSQAPELATPGKRNLLLLYSSSPKQITYLTCRDSTYLSSQALSSYLRANLRDLCRQGWGVLSPPTLPTSRPCSCPRQASDTRTLRPRHGLQN